MTRLLKLLKKSKGFSKHKKGGGNMSKKTITINNVEFVDTGKKPTSASEEIDARQEIIEAYFEAYGHHYFDGITVVKASQFIAEHFDEISARISDLKK